MLLLRALRRPGRSPQTPTQRQTTEYLAWYSLEEQVLPRAQVSASAARTEAALSSDAQLMPRFFGDGAMHMLRNSLWKSITDQEDRGTQDEAPELNIINHQHLPRAGTAFLSSEKLLRGSTRSIHRRALMMR